MFTHIHAMPLPLVSAKVVVLLETSLQFSKMPTIMCFCMKHHEFSVLTTPPMQNCHFFTESKDFLASPDIKEVADLRQGSSFLAFFIFFLLEIRGL